MNTNKQPLRNEALKAAFAETAEQRYAAYMTAPPHDFSAEFTKKMNLLIHCQKQNYWKLVNTTGKRVAAACIVFAVLASSAMTVEAVRVPVVEFIQRVYRECTDFIFHRAASEAPAPESIETVYGLMTVPERFTKSYFGAEELSVNTVWESKDGETIVLTQNVLGILASVDTEGSTCTKVSVNGYEGFSYVKPDQISIVWASESYSFVLSYSGKQLDSDAMVQLAGSLRPAAEDS